MNARRPQGNRRSRQRRGPARDLWSVVPAPEAPEPIRPATEPTALITSLGAPPLRGHSSTAEYYLTAVVERAAAIASALAASVDLLAAPDDA